jgi:hypothetical protein
VRDEAPSADLPAGAGWEHQTASASSPQSPISSGDTGGGPVRRTRAGNSVPAYATPGTQHFERSKCSMSSRSLNVTEVSQVLGYVLLLVVCELIATPAFDGV